jgi:hypothetical protein
MLVTHNTRIPSFVGRLHCHHQQQPHPTNQIKQTSTQQSPGGSIIAMDQKQRGSKRLPDT